MGCICVIDIVNITFAGETCKRYLCEQLRFGDLVGELHVVDVYLTFCYAFMLFGVCAGFLENHVDRCPHITSNSDDSI